MNRRKLLKAASTLALAAPILNAKPKPKFEWITVQGRATKFSVIVPQELISKNDVKGLMAFYRQAMIGAQRLRKNPKEILVLHASFPFSKELMKAIYESNLPDSSSNFINPKPSS